MTKAAWPQGLGIFAADQTFRSPAWSAFLARATSAGVLPDLAKWPAFRNAHPSNRDKPNVLGPKPKSITFSNSAAAQRRRKNAIGAT